MQPQQTLIDLIRSETLRQCSPLIRFSINKAIKDELLKLKKITTQGGCSSTQNVTMFYPDDFGYSQGKMNDFNTYISNINTQETEALRKTIQETFEIIKSALVGNKKYEDIQITQQIKPVITKELYNNLKTRIQHQLDMNLASLSQDVIDSNLAQAQKEPNPKKYATDKKNTNNGKSDISKTFVHHNRKIACTVTRQNRGSQDCGDVFSSQKLAALSISEANSKIFENALKRAEETDQDYGGGTFLHAVVVKETIITASLGDSRALVYQNGKCYNLNWTHSASNESEKKRIEELGGFVTDRGSYGIRTCGQTLTSGSLGDKDIVGTTRIPVLTNYKITDPSGFLILCSDGNVLSPDEIAEIIKASSGDVDEIANKIYEATRYLNGNDDVTIQVLRLFDGMSGVVSDGHGSKIIPKKAVEKTVSEFYTDSPYIAVTAQKSHTSSSSTTPAPTPVVGKSLAPPSPLTSPTPSVATSSSSPRIVDMGYEDLAKQVSHVEQRDKYFYASMAIYKAILQGEETTLEQESKRQKTINTMVELRNSINNPSTKHLGTLEDLAAAYYQSIYYSNDVKKVIALAKVQLSKNKASSQNGTTFPIDYCIERAANMLKINTNELKSMTSDEQIAKLTDAAKQQIPLLGSTQSFFGKKQRHGTLTVFEVRVKKEDGEKCFGDSYLKIIDSAKATDSPVTTTVEFKSGAKFTAEVQLPFGSSNDNDLSFSFSSNVEAKQFTKEIGSNEDGRMVMLVY